MHCVPNMVALASLFATSTVHVLWLYNLKV